VAGDREAIARAQFPTNAKLLEDWNGEPVAVFESEWSVRLAAEWNPALTFEPFFAQPGKETVTS
jgi:peptide subunit release factor RF-3